MCGRYSLTRHALTEIAQEIGATFGNGITWRPRYNVAPGDSSLIVHGERRLVRAVWGMGEKPQVNVRSESVSEGRFREAFEGRRCLVVADGFYEWTGGRGRRRPIWFHPAAGGLLRVAGLWERRGDGQLTFTVLTTAANALVAATHDRMPVLLDRDGAADWLKAPRRELLRPAPEGALTATPVSSRVNSTAHDDPDLGPPDDPQLDLW